MGWVVVVFIVILQLFELQLKAKNVDSLQRERDILASRMRESQQLVHELDVSSQSPPSRNTMGAPLCHLTPGHFCAIGSPKLRNCPELSFIRLIPKTKNKKQ